MLITPATEHALIELARRGLWLEVIEDRLQVITTRPDAGMLTDALKAQLATHRAELLQVVPVLEASNQALTGPVVRVLYARLPADQQLATSPMTAIEFSDRYNELTIAERVQYLWIVMDGPRPQNEFGRAAA